MPDYENTPNWVNVETCGTQALSTGIKFRTEDKDVVTVSHVATGLCCWFLPRKGKELNFKSISVEISQDLLGIKPGAPHKSIYQGKDIGSFGKAMREGNFTGLFNDKGEIIVLIKLTKESKKIASDFLM